ncbi:MAG: protein phosphatase 2C domain-containing protein [Oscillospiraceae bacterium]|jgi:serine/threonine protein phosphatase PrpC|nr:protein phosphatase 2C domain-containing protein [Oscillospiraceae bacterium]
MEFDIGSFSSAGGKEKNEDTVLVLRKAHGLAAVVADGLGAHGGGEIASASAAAAIRGALPETGYTDTSALSACFQAANKAVLANQKPGVAMKSTAVLLAIEREKAVFAHVGDSRGYCFRAGKLSGQTMDHSASQLAVLRGTITADQIRFHESRSRLLRALGADEAAHEEILPLPAPLPGDAYLLCSDGFWEYVTEPEMEADLAKSRSASAWLSYMLSRAGARLQAEHDNLSAIAVLCNTANA